MPLSGGGPDQLAAAVAQQWDVATLRLFLSDELDVALDAVTSAGTLENKVRDVVVHLIGQRPRRDDELLEALLRRGNAALRNLATVLLDPPYYSPTNDPVDAILLGEMPFVDRRDLRAAVRRFVNPTVNSTRVLVVRGTLPGGKSYTRQFLRHLAGLNGVVFQPISLAGADLTPRQLVEEVFTLLEMDRGALPPAVDDAADATQIRPLLTAFQAKVHRLDRRYWLVIDDLNDRSVTSLVRETAHKLAAVVETVKPENLGVALLGDNDQFADADLALAAQEDAVFPDAHGLAEHYALLAATGPLPLTTELALDYATRELAKFPQLTKLDMIGLTVQVKRTGEQLRRGERP